MLALLVGLAILGLISTAAVQSGTLLQRRGAERDLLFIGGEFERALASYAAASPPGTLRAPRSLDDLLRDPRLPGLRRHLRRVYVDPMTGTTDWGSVRSADGGIVAVHSRSTAKPIQQANFPLGWHRLEAQDRYADWQFGSVAPAPQALDRRAP